MVVQVCDSDGKHYGHNLIQVQNVSNVVALCSKQSCQFETIANCLKSKNTIKGKSPYTQRNSRPLVLTSEEENNFSGDLLRRFLLSFIFFLNECLLHHPKEFLRRLLQLTGVIANDVVRDHKQQLLHPRE